ncbi:MAG: flagellar export chaperone FliS [Bacteriovoracia bacterium]
MSNNAYNKYKQTQVTTASRGKILLMLYEACMKNLRIAADAINRKDLAEKGKHIVKAHDIINELSLSLNHEVGGNISKELERLYVYMVEQITEANVKNDSKPIEITLKLLQTLYEGWVEAVAKADVSKVSNE